VFFEKLLGFAAIAAPRCGIDQHMHAPIIPVSAPFGCVGPSLEANEQVIRYAPSVIPSGAVFRPSHVAKSQGKAHPSLCHPEQLAVASWQRNERQLSPLSIPGNDYQWRRQPSPLSSRGGDLLGQVKGGMNVS
jgi:hypothetical protein